MTRIFCKIFIKFKNIIIYIILESIIKYYIARSNLIFENQNNYIYTNRYSNINLLSLFKNEQKYSESSGYYERVPLRVKSFVLVKNTENKVVYHTTSQDFCNKGPTLKLIINKNDNDRWGVNIRHGGISRAITYYDELHSERLSRRRAFWHAGQYMSGNDLNHKERYTLMYKVSNEDSNIFDADAFFKDGDPITTDPFGEFLK